VTSLVKYLKRDKKIRDVVVRETESQLRSLQDAVVSTGDVSYQDYFRAYLEKNVEDLATRARVMSEFTKYLEKTDYADLKSMDHWDLKSLKFGNLFSYGEGNTIDFDRISGIAGIFAKNRAGKSSIVGSLCYSLFNEVDRSLPRSHFIINSDSDSCNSEVTFSARGCEYTVKRATSRVKTKKGESSTTNVSLSRNDGGKSTALDDEQRRETDKVIRSIIGSPADFFESAVASQGQLLNFLDHKSTSRKQILTKFLGLDAYERVYELARTDLSPIRHLLKGDTKISDLRHDIATGQSQILEFNNDLVLIETREKELREQIGLISEESLLHALRTQKSDLCKVQKSNMLRDLEENEGTIITSAQSIKDHVSKISSLDEIINDPSVDVAKKSLDDIKRKESDLRLLEKDFLHKSKDKENLVSSCNILNDVPCGDQFSSCQFKKDAIDAKSKMPEVVDTLEKLTRAVETAKREIATTEISRLQAIIEKAAKATDLKRKIQSQIESLQFQSERASEKIKD
jgi:DNA repair exonuclease SbcCD ATPase subunit